jgi:hypothetical protein
MAILLDDFPIMKSLEKTSEQTLSFDADDLTKTFTITANALTHTIIVDTDDFTNASNTVITITNSDSRVIYTSGNCAENATTILSTETPIVGTNTVTATVSGVLGGTGGDVRVVIYLQARGY